jgi:hypothetical protein
VCQQLEAIETQIETINNQLRNLWQHQNTNQSPANVEIPMPNGMETREATGPIVVSNAGRMTHQETKYGFPPQT